MKKLKLNFSLTLSAVFLSIVFIVACHNDDSPNENAAKIFLKAFKMNLPELKSLHVKARTVTRAKREDTFQNENNSSIYIEYPEDTPNSKKDLSPIKNFNELLLLVNDVGAELSSVKTETTSDSLVISNNDVNEILAPSIIESKKYLYAKGFTDLDIEDMLSENNVEESALVPFVLACIEQENNAYTTNAQNLNPILSIFATRAHAASINYKRAGYCAMEAIGADIFWGISKSDLKTWTVRTIKKAFKTIAKRVVGPIGALIVAGEFSYCYFR